MAPAKKTTAASAASGDTSAARAARSFLESRPQQKVFPEHEAKGLLADAGLPVPRGIYIDRSEGLSSQRLASHNLKYPLVVKVASSVIAHKTDVGGVITGILDPEGIREAVQKVLAIEGAEGALVEEMAPKGVEVIVGGIIDPQFGPVVMFGLGGVFVELYKDVVFGLAPLSHEDAAALLGRIRGLPLLQGYRGAKPSDMDSLSRIIVAASEMLATGLIGELDLNPVVVYPEGAIILDAKIKSAAW